MLRLKASFHLATAPASEGPSNSDPPGLILIILSKQTYSISLDIELMLYCGLKWGRSERYIVHVQPGLTAVAASCLRFKGCPEMLWNGRPFRKDKRPNAMGHFQEPGHDCRLMR